MPQLLNTLATPEQVARTPSRLDGMPADLEEELRMYGCQLIQQAGILLKLPQVTMATAQVLYQRFWFVSSFRQFGMRDVAMGALFLASKLEETPRRVRDLINVSDYLVCRAQHQSRHSPGPRTLQLLKARREKMSMNGNRANVPAFEYRPMSYFATEFYDAKDALVIAEMQILKRLGFQVQVNLPYATMVNYLQLLGLARVKGVGQRAWSLLNDALQTPVYVLFPPHLLAAASIYLTSITMPGCPPLPLEPAPWWELLDVTRAELRIVCSYFLRLYDTDKGIGDDNDSSLGQGLASRVREEWGGMCDFCEKAAVRDWLAAFGSPIDNTPSTSIATTTASRSD